MVNVKPDLIGITLAISFPILGAITAHFKNFSAEHFYQAFAAHALDMRDSEMADGDVIKLPRIDRAMQEYKRSGEYMAATNLSIVRHYRSAVIGATAGTAMAIVAGFSSEGYDIFGTFRKEEDQTTQVSVGEQDEDIALPLLSPALPQS